MTPADAWAALGIEATEDMRAIRVAYTRALKAIDPDADPQAFIALREARDTAERVAQPQEAWQPSTRPIQPQGEYEFRPAAVEAEFADHDRPPSPPPPDHAVAEAHARDLYALIHGEREGRPDWATEEERAAMLAHWQGIAADPRLEEIGFFGQVENWAVGLIAYNTPLSDPLIIPATEFFGWTNSDDTVAQSREIAHITYRYSWMRYLDDVQQPEHPHHPAWVELCTPAPPGSKRGRLGPARVTDLLDTVRMMRPDLESRFDPARIALWERREAPPPEHPAPAPPSRYTKSAAVYVVLAIVALIFVLNLIGAAQRGYDRNIAPQPGAADPNRVYTVPMPPPPAPVYVPPPIVPAQPGDITTAKPISDADLNKLIRELNDKDERDFKAAPPPGNSSR